tara:strand:+ start:2219 stop:3961 length:1743 start_codon:yes stop_codon:yes gene_type:complete
MKITWKLQSRKRKDGRQNLYVRLRDGRRLDLPIYLEIYVFGKYWDSKNRLLDKRHPEAEELNRKIIEYNTRMDRAMNLAISGVSNSRIVATIKKQSKLSTLEEYIDDYLTPEKNKSISDTQLENQTTFYRRFKAICGIKRALRWEDINNDLYKKYYTKYEPLLRDEKIAKRTYKNYAYAPLWIFNRALEDEIVSIAKPSIKLMYRSPSTRGKVKDNLAIDSTEIEKGIMKADTIQRWEAFAIWLLQFGLRGIGNSDIVRLKDSLLKNKKKRQASRSMIAHQTNDLYFDYARSKTGSPMYIRLFPPVKRILEKLKYSFIHTLSHKRFDGKEVVTGLKNMYSLLDYDSKRHNSNHKSLFRKRSDKFKDMGFPEIDFSTARNTFIQTAMQTTERNVSIVKLLVGQTGDKLLQNHYLNYSSKDEIELMEKHHRKVLEKFNYMHLVNMLMKQLKIIVDNNGAPKWILKQGGVIVRNREYNVMVDIENRKPVYATIPTSLRKYFNDPSMKDNYWLDEDEYFNPKLSPSEEAEQRHKRVVKATEYIEKLKKEREEKEALMKAKIREENKLINKEAKVVPMKEYIGLN